jgi:SpoVK/Ycf46/Vps4 family AAA+-type ATPase
MAPLSSRFTDSQIGEFVTYVKREQDFLAHQVDRRLSLQEQDDQASLVQKTIVEAALAFALIDRNLSDDEVVLITCLVQGSTEQINQIPRPQLRDILMKSIRDPQQRDILTHLESSTPIATSVQDEIEEIGKIVEHFQAMEKSVDQPWADRARALFLRIAETVVATDGNVSPAEEAQIDALRDRLRGSEGREGEAQLSTATISRAEAKPVPARSSPDALAPRALEDILAELNSLIGLQPVKGEVQELVAFLRVQHMRKEHALPGVSVSLHLVFYGNPGTGKTSVARLIAEAYRALGVLSKGHLVETDRSGLVAGYLGQTALKVQQVTAEAMGGVLFIDEAYALAPPDHEDPYGAEAIATLLKLMEDHRGELVVIAAGYPGEMKRLLDSNPGLRSRFGKYFNFADYNPDELRAIFEIFCNKGGVSTIDGCLGKAVGRIPQCVRAKGLHFRQCEVCEERLRARTGASGRADCKRGDRDR